MFIGMVGVSLKINSCNLIIVLDVFATFAENKLRSAKQEQAPFALTCIIFAENKLHSAKQEQTPFALTYIIFSRKEQTLDNHYI